MVASAFAARGAQYELSAIVELNTTDTLLTTTGVVQALNTAGTSVYDAVLLPRGSIITTGALIVETANNATGASTVAIGDSTAAARFLAATTTATAATTPFTGTYQDNTPGNNLRITIVNADATSTVGKILIKVNYVIRGRVNEAVPN